MRLPFSKTGISQESAFMQTVIIGLVNSGLLLQSILLTVLATVAVNRHSRYECVSVIKCVGIS